MRNSGNSFCMIITCKYSTILSRFNFSLLISQDPMPPVTCRAKRKVPSFTKQAREASALFPNLPGVFGSHIWGDCQFNWKEVYIVQMPHQILGNEKKPADWTPAINHADHSGRPSMAQSWFSRCSLVTAGGCGVCSNWSLITDHSEAPVLQTNKKISDGCDMWSSQGCIYVSATFRDIQSWSKQTRNMHAVKHAPMIFK